MTEGKKHDWRAKTLRRFPTLEDSFVPENISPSKLYTKLTSDHTRMMIYGFMREYQTPRRELASLFLKPQMESFAAGLEYAQHRLGKKLRASFIVNNDTYSSSFASKGLDLKEDKITLIDETPCLCLIANSRNPATHAIHMGLGDLAAFGRKEPFGMEGLSLPRQLNAAESTFYIALEEAYHTIEAHTFPKRTAQEMQTYPHHHKYGPAYENHPIEARAKAFVTLAFEEDAYRTTTQQLKRLNGRSR